MNRRLLKLLTVIILIISILVTVFCFLFNRKNSGKHQTDKELLRSANYQVIEEDDGIINGTDNVKFISYFLRDIDEDGIEEKLNGTCKRTGKTDKLYMKLDVLCGTLKNGKITINSNNFSLITSIVKNEMI